MFIYNKRMDKLKEQISKVRNLRPSTINLYVFNINKLHKKMYEGKEMTDIKFLKNTNNVINNLADLKPTTQKTYLASIVVALDSQKEKEYEKPLDKYRELMIENIKSYNAELKEQKKSGTQDKNWTTIKALRKVITNYKKQLDTMGTFQKSKEQISRKEKDILQKWLVGSLYIIDNKNPPLRNDYTPMEIVSLSQYNSLSDKELEDNNYLVIQSRNKKYFSFGEYKTSKTYGIKKIDIGSKLNSVLNIYLKYHDSKYLLLNNRADPMSANGLTKYIQKVFEPTGKKISANLLRHIYISEFITGPTLKEKEELGEKMGHNVATQELYKKN